MAKEEEKQRFEVRQVTTAQEPFVVDSETNEVYTITQAMCKVMNDIEVIRKSLS